MSSTQSNQNSPYIIEFTHFPLTDQELEQLAPFQIKHLGKTRFGSARLTPENARKLQQLSFVKYVERKVTHYPLTQ